MTLTQVRASLFAFEKHTHTKDIAPRDLRLLESGELWLESKKFKLTPEAETSLTKLVQCPSSFFTSIPNDLRATLVNRLLVDSSRIMSDRLLVLIKNEQILGFSNPSLLHLSGSEVLHTALSAKPKSISEDLDVRRFELTPDTLLLEVSSPQASIEIRADEIISAGLSIRHSPNGSFATKISTYLHRLVCTNGMTVPVCNDDKRLRVRRLDSSRFTKQELIKNLHAISAKAWDELDLKLEAFATLRTKKVRVSAVLNDLVKRMRLKDKVAKALRQAVLEDELGFDSSQMGVVNALARVATHSSLLTARAQCRLTEAAGVLSQEHVHRCPTCFSVIYKRSMN